jgi:hypothetical protein
MLKEVNCLFVSEAVVAIVLVNWASVNESCFSRNVVVIPGGAGAGRMGAVPGDQEVVFGIRRQALRMD